MTISELIAKKNSRIDNIPSKFQTSVEKLQRDIFKKIIDEIGQLELKNGSIVMSEANLYRVQQINDQLKQVLSGREYLEAVNRFTSEFDTQKAINDQYFRKAFGSDFSDTSLAKRLVAIAKRNTTELLTGAQAESNFILPIRSQLEKAVASGASLKDTVSGIRDFVEGTSEADGRLVKYSGQVAFDAFAISDASYTNAIAEDIGVEWFWYLGGLVKDSRCFCIERNGKFYHYKEIQAWGRGEDLGECNIGDGRWAGERPETNESTIFLTRGGYRCNHTFSPVSITLVPRDIILRNIDNGNFVPSEFERKELNL